MVSFFIFIVKGMIDIIFDVNIISFLLVVNVNLDICMYFKLKECIYWI